jgi:hypothetical protein
LDSLWGNSAPYDTSNINANRINWNDDVIMMAKDGMALNKDDYWVDASKAIA